MLSIIRQLPLYRTRAIHPIDLLAPLPMYENKRIIIRQNCRKMPDNWFYPYLAAKLIFQYGSGLKGAG